METRLKLTKSDGSAVVNATMYRSVVGGLRYLVNTRSYIAYAAEFVSQFMEAPTTQHLAAVKHLLRYVAGTVDYDCHYLRHDAKKISLAGFSDNDLAGDIGDRKSTTGVTFFLDGCPVSWTSQKQRIVAFSSCEAEYITTSCQGVCLSRLVSDLMGNEPEKATIFVDNKSAIALCKKLVLHDRSKHINVRYHFIRDCIEEGQINVKHVSMENQLAYILTKSLGRIRFSELMEKFSIKNVIEG